VLAVGRLEPQKRLDVLVDAVAGWPTAPAPAVFIAGTGSLEADLRRRIGRSASPVQLLGRREDVADLLAAADVVVLPSAWEGYPLVAQEALRAGRPLIATPVGGVPDLVGDAAVLVPVGHPQALRRALLDLLGDPAARERRARAGRAQAARWPSVEQMVDDVVDNYLDLKSRVRLG
jgi:glycosyltransferase involved in cell wall biosynthesis